MKLAIFSRILLFFIIFLSFNTYAWYFGMYSKFSNTYQDDCDQYNRMGVVKRPSGAYLGKKYKVGEECSVKKRRKEIYKGQLMGYARDMPRIHNVISSCESDYLKSSDKLSELSIDNYNFIRECIIKKYDMYCAKVKSHLGEEYSSQVGMCSSIVVPIGNSRIRRKF